MLIHIRKEHKDDEPAIHAVHRAAFGRAEEAVRVGQLRKGSPRFVSLVAETDGAIVGHILFTPAVAEADGKTVAGMGLGPLAVLPARQRKGIGSALVRAGLEEMRASGAAFVVLVGHPDYYPKFGFKRAGPFGLRCEYDQVPEDAFLIRVLQPAAIEGIRGVVRFRPEFAAAV
jgi:putative acetyltransferase